MKITVPVVTLATWLVLAAFPAQAEEAKFEPRKDDAIKTLLARQVGQPVKIRLKAGEELGGTLTMVGDHVAYLSRLSGREYFDAAVNLDAIAAVIIKARGN